MSFFNFDDMLDKEVDALPDIPERPVLPAGKYILSIVKLERKDVAQRDSIIFTYKVAETLELAQPGVEALEPGTEVQEIFTLDDADKIGFFRKHLLAVGNKRVLGVLMQELPGTFVIITAKTRKWKDKNSGEEKVGWSTVGGLQPMGE